GAPTMSTSYLPTRRRSGGEVMRTSGSSPDDTRFPVAALGAGALAAGALGGGLLLAGRALPFALGAGVIGGLLAGSSLKYTDQWEKAVVLRMGRYRGLRGPGMFAVIPVIDRIGYHIDQRIRTTAFGAESCLTKDTVPVDVDAIAFWV